MKLIKAESDQYTFQLTRREKHLLFEVLHLYPVLNPARYRLGKNTGDSPTDQQLLEEALAAHRRENKVKLLAMLNDAERFKEHPGGCHFSLDAQQIEWLLQVLNDIRVGSWVTLGCPDEKKGKSIKAAGNTITRLWAMEFSGRFETALLEALGGQT